MNKVPFLDYFLLDCSLPPNLPPSSELLPSVTTKASLLSTPVADTEVIPYVYTLLTICCLVYEYRISFCIIDNIHYVAWIFIRTFFVSFKTINHIFSWLFSRLILDYLASFQLVSLLACTACWLCWMCMRFSKKLLVLKLYNYKVVASGLLHNQADFFVCFFKEKCI